MKTFPIVCAFYECETVAAIVKNSKVTAVYYMPCELDKAMIKAKAEKAQLVYGSIQDMRFSCGSV